MSTSLERTSRVVVVGGGCGGLAVASRVAHAMRNKQNGKPCEVILVEKNSEEMIGGRCGSFDVTLPEWGTFRHERGPSLLLLKREYESLFEDCGSSPSEHGLRFEQCVPAYQVVFNDGSRVDLGFPSNFVSAAAAGGKGDFLKEAERTSREKMDVFEANGSEKWDAYMESTSAFLDCGLPNFIEERLDLVSFPAFLREALKDWGKAWPLKPHSDVIEGFFSSEKMRALSSFQDLYVGLEPFKNERELGGGVLKKTAPAVFGLLSALELHPDNSKAGVFAPVGGFRSVSEAFSSLAEQQGVRIHYNTTVTQISEGGVHCIVPDNSKDDGTLSSSSSNNKTATFLPADVIIVNADVPYSQKSLFAPKGKTEQPPSPHEERFDWNDKYDFSSGVIAFHWSTKKPLSNLNTHNVFLAATCKKEAYQSWRVLRDPSPSSSSSGKMEPFNFYVHRASKTDPTASPPECDSVLILVPCHNLTRQEKYADLPRDAAMQKYKDQFGKEFVSTLREAVFERLAVLDGLEDLRDCIVDEVVDTPGTYADMYNVGSGVPFGLSHGFNQLSLTRPAPESTGVKNAFFVGASTRPGNGVPLVLIGAKSVADKVVKKLEQ